MVAMPNCNRGGPSGTERFQERLAFQRSIKGFPPGWSVLQFHECKCGRDHDAVVLCERTTEDGDHGLRYAVWWVNMDLGGCYNGDYTDDLATAQRSYDRRKGKLK